MAPPNRLPVSPVRVPCPRIHAGKTNFGRTAVELARKPSARRSMVRLVLALLVVSVSGLMAEAARAECRGVAEELQSALAARDLDAARRLYGRAWEEAACGDTFRARAGRAVSVLHARVAQDRMEAGASLASQQEVLERGLDYGRTWPVLALLGDAAHDVRDYGRASTLYQEALTAIDDTAMTPKPPPRSEIERIFHRAGLSRMLASDYLPSPRTRSGAAGGLAAAAIRGFAVERVPVPITFYTGSAEFTGTGRRAAADMADYLLAQKPARITIAGHTDPRGSEGYNLDLSRQRAEAVARFLREQGFLGRVEVVAKGENERFPAADLNAYTREQRWQLDRRVELIR